MKPFKPIMVNTQLSLITMCIDAASIKVNSYRVFLVLKMIQLNNCYMI
jgi:hypothetical protein